MKYETVKTFILSVLVGISFLLTFILLSYQPNYDSIYDTSYVNEVDIGGSEKTKNELVEPTEIIFRHDDKAFSFMNPLDRQLFYQDLASWVLYDTKIIDANGRPDADMFVELVFPSAIPVAMVTSLFTFNDQIEFPDWAFERVFITPQDQSLELTILSVDKRKQVVGTIEKSESYQLILSYLEEQGLLKEYLAVHTTNDPIYIPKNKVELAGKTLVASTIAPESFINALFTDPSYVTQNLREVYFTDGQRGMRIVQEGRKLEFINPIQSNYDLLHPIELLDKSINNINEHKGWTNSFQFENIIQPLNSIRFRLYYEGYPVFDRSNLSTIEQEWREQELHRYTRPLIRIGNLLNSREVEIPSGEEIISLLEKDKDIDIEKIKDIQVGYSLTYLDDAHSLTLEPSWYILYQGDWLKFNLADYDDLHAKGGN